MNKTNYFARKLVVGAVALAFAAMVAQVSAENIPQQITVLKVHGAARYSTDNGKTWINSLKRGDVLQTGTVIQTADDSTVDIMMGKETGTIAAQPISVTGGHAGAGGSSADSGPKANIVHMYPNSSLAIDKLSVEKTGVDEVSETQLDLRAGKILGNVKKLSAASRYEVKVPNGVAGIRGTTYVIDATGTIYVLDGQVIISFLQNGVPVTVTINAGDNFNPFTAPVGSQPTPTPPAQEVPFVQDSKDANGNFIPTVPPSAPVNGVTIQVSQP